MGTITMTGFSVDADGDTVTKSINNSSGGITNAGAITGATTIVTTGTVTVGGDLRVLGTTTTIDSTNTTHKDHLIGLNVDANDTNTIQGATGILLNNIRDDGGRHGFIGYEGDTFKVGSTDSTTDNGVNAGLMQFQPRKLQAAEFNASSDRNMKENIRSIEDFESILKSINGVRYDWKSSHRPSAGVIAQEVETVFSEAVTTDRDGTKSVNYNCLIAVLIECVKAQRELIDDLAVRVGKLEQ